ncbi:MAG: UTP--glucose-1-phosphate uridylyltransferase [Myxococcota bacterium]
MGRVGRAGAKRIDDAALARFAARMRREKLPEIAIRSFLRAVRFVAEGGATVVPEASIEPVATLPALASLERHAEAGRRAAAQAVVIKLNGGLGTSMGLAKAKSLLPVRPGISFLDLIARQVLHQRARLAVDLPLVLMNSYRTRDDSLAALLVHPELEKQVPLDFVQHKVPRIDAETWRPVEWPADPSLEWCPPGHGDLYIALASSGMLETLRSNGFRWAFVSNADNLGATLDLRLLGWLAETGLPFAMEVAERTPADRKGGHLALRDGRLILRESAQCAPEDVEAFQDVARHHYFNTNNLWLDLDALAAALAASPDGLPLPVIHNEKRVSPDDPTSPRCYQLETAMGSAIESFEGARAIAVPRERFAPVKTTSDLLVLWSDAYELASDARMVPRDAEASRRRVIELDPRFYARIADFEERFEHGAPSLRACRKLVVRGDFRFGPDVVIEGEVALENPDDGQRTIPGGTRLAG